MLVNEYISQFGDFRINSAKAKGNQIGKDLVKCKLCNDGCDYTTTAFSFHLKKKHNLVKEEYISTHLLNGEQPKCKCGCGNSTTIKSYFLPYTTEYISGHNKSTLGYKFSDDSISKMKAKAVSRTEQFRANGETAPWHSKEALEKRGKNRLYGISYSQLFSFHAKQHESQVNQNQCSYESGHKNAILSTM
jgi:hypothetical protein